MKKLQLVIIFLLWILLGLFGYQLKLQWNNLHQPIISSWKIDISALISSVTDVLDQKYVPGAWGEYGRFDEVLNLLDEYYYDQEKINTGAMIENAVKAFVDALDDPYTVYMDAKQNSWFQQDLKWEADFEGIGAVVSKKEYYVMIEEILKDSPAFKAGLLPLDRIIMVGTWSVKDLDLNDAVALIRGPKWSKVKLLIERIAKNWTKEVIEKEVTRDKLIVPSVTSKILTWKNNTSLGYINISVIGEETENILKQNIIELKKKKLHGIILDLRGNGWGLLPIAVEISSHFVPLNKIIVTAKYKQLGEETFRSKWYSDLGGIPVVVLIDWMTASAWEIIALALKEQIGAKLVGAQSFGKWTIQTMDDFKDWASLKYTIGKRYAPSWTNINKTGITPDVVVEFDRDAYAKSWVDNQLKKSIDILAK